MNGAHRQRGIALLIALLTVALAAVLIAGLLDRGELALARTRNALRGEQAEAYAQGLEAYAARVLIKDAPDAGDSNTDPWAMPLPPQTRSSHASPLSKASRSTRNDQPGVRQNWSMPRMSSTHGAVRR